MFFVFLRGIYVQNYEGPNSLNHSFIRSLVSCSVVFVFHFHGRLARIQRLLQPFYIGSPKIHNRDWILFGCPVVRSTTALLMVVHHLVSVCFF